MAAEKELNAIKATKGGKRTGAGRKAGIPNKKTQALVDEVEKSGLTPLQYMLKVMRNTAASGDRRDRMAAAAAPYIHPKLASIEHKGPDDGPIQFQQITRRIVKA